MESNAKATAELGETTPTECAGPAQPYELQMLLLKPSNCRLDACRLPGFMLKALGCFKIQAASFRLEAASGRQLVMLESKNCCTSSPELTLFNRSNLGMFYAFFFFLHKGRPEFEIMASSALTSCYGEFKMIPQFA